MVHTVLSVLSSAALLELFLEVSEGGWSVTCMLLPGRQRQDGKVTLIGYPARVVHFAWAKMLELLVGRMWS